MPTKRAWIFIFVAEHHFDMGFSECPNPGSFLGAASQRTKQIRIGPLVYVLPLWNPIRVAEEVALLDNLTEGRLECGFGAGIGPFTFTAYGVPWDDKRQMTLEALRIIRGIWANPSYSYEGRFFKCNNAELSIPLVQKPHPPLWMPTRSKDSIEEAAATGISTVQWVPSGMKATGEPPSTNTARPIKETNPRDRNRTWDSCGKSTWRQRTSRRGTKAKVTGSIFGNGAVGAEPTAVTAKAALLRFWTAHGNRS